VGGLDLRTQEGLVVLRAGEGGWTEGGGAGGLTI
jgi:hypothetical protein